MSAMHQDRTRAQSFGSDAQRYDRSRPSYPEALLDDVIGPAPAPLDVLDVGCGTGIVARQMASRGARVLGVEPDARMAEVARRRGVEVDVARFEEWDPKRRTFDRVTAGQVWHWIDPERGAARAASILRPAGRVCLFWNIGQPQADVKEVLDEVYAELAPDADSSSVVLGYAVTQAYQAGRACLRACPDLTDPEERRYPWRRTYTREEWLDQLPTHSDHAVLGPEHLARVLAAAGDVIDRFGGSFVMEYSTLLLTSTRTPPPGSGQ